MLIIKLNGIFVVWFLMQLNFVDNKHVNHRNTMKNIQQHNENEDSKRTANVTSALENDLYCSLLKTSIKDCLLLCEPKHQTTNIVHDGSINLNHDFTITSIKMYKFLSESVYINRLLNETSLSGQLQVFHATNLKRSIYFADVLFLDLSGNSIETVQNEDFSKFERLNYLNLSKNMLKNLESHCFDYLTGLTNLDLSNNKLTNIPANLFFQLTNLISLNVSSNKFINFSLSYLTFNENLEHLDLGNNQIKHLDHESFAVENKITYLILDGNQFKNVPPIISQSLKHLTNLSMNNNPIEEISKSSLVSLHDLTHISFNSMPRLKSVEKGAFQNLSSLQTIDMNFNYNLTYVDVHSFITSPNVQEINLDHNNLHVLSSHFLDNFHRIQVIKLVGNPFTNDCNNQWKFTCQPCLIDPEIYFISQKPNGRGSICNPYIFPMFEKYYHLAVGEPLKLKCRGVGIEPINVYWSFIGLGSRYHNYHDHEELDDLHWRQNKSTISVDHVAPYHAGLYTCNVQSNTSKQMANTTVRIYNRNATVYFTSYSRTSVTVEWSGTETTMKTTEYFITCRRLIEPHIQFVPYHGEQKAKLASYDNSTDLPWNSSSAVNPTLSQLPAYQHKLPLFSYGEGASLSFIKVKIGPFMRRNTFNGLSPMTPYEICLCVSNSTDKRFLHVPNDKNFAPVSNAQHFKSPHDNSYHTYDNEDHLIELSCFNFTTLDRSTNGFDYEPGIRRLPILQILLGTFGCLAVFIILYAVCNSLVSNYGKRLVSSRSNKQSINNVYKLVTCRSERRNSLTLVPMETTFTENSKSSSRTSLIS